MEETNLILYVFTFCVMILANLMQELMSESQIKHLVPGTLFTSYEAEISIGHIDASTQCFLHSFSIAGGCG